MKVLVPFIAILFAAAPAEAADIAQAQELYERTDYSGALRIVLTDKNPGAAAWALAGESSFMLGDLSRAGEYFQKAIAMEPANAEYVLWLGRTWGRKAEKANALAAMRDASRARENFEKAVKLDPRSVAALDDLFDYYLQAPGLMGGGLDEAEAIAYRIEAIDRAQGLFDLAQLAVKRKQSAEAENDFRTAANLAPKAVGHLIAFARYLAQQGRLKESDAVLARAETTVPEDPRLLYGKASIEIETHRNLKDARKLLERYLTSNLTPDDPPREAAEKLLRQTVGS